MNTVAFNTILEETFPPYNLYRSQNLTLEPFFKSCKLLKCP